MRHSFFKIKMGRQVIFKIIYLERKVSSPLLDVSNDNKRENF